MKNFYCLIFLLSLFVSCKDNSEPESGAMKNRFIQGAYYIPSEMVYADSLSNNGLVLLKGTYITLSQDSATFMTLAREYGEMGNREFELPLHPCAKPYGIKSVKVYQVQDGERSEVSYDFKIRYEDYSFVIESNYTDSNYRYIEKRVSMLDDHDLKWLSNSFNIFNCSKGSDVSYIVVLLENGEELSLKLEE